MTTVLKGQSGFLTGSTIKIIAFVLMVLDHVHQMWAHAGAPLWLTMLGRPVFPMFLFLITESFYHTSNRQKLLLRLLIASWIMQFVSLVLGMYLLPNDSIILLNNAFATFFITVLYMLFYEIFKGGVKEKSAKKIAGAIGLALLPILAIIPVMTAAMAEPPNVWLVRILLFLPNAFVLEGGPFMVILGLAFYILRPWRWAQALALLVLSVLQFVIDPASIQWLMVFAIIPIFLYNGEKGKGMKNFFYIGYPLHIWILYIIATLTVG
ncbi:MAG: conjugal transfer protein TraX [Defluviitaleaceae bacterium]|nr:conjugal transfer protein TraX [Defluviitaleaceae bacterium]